MNELDPRIVRVGFEIDGALKMYEGLAITANGTKYANPNQNECEVTISNLSKAVRDEILTQTSPFNKNRTPKRMVVEIGRVSTGVMRIFTGDITNTTIGQPPDITIKVKSLTKNFSKGDVVSRNQRGRVPLSTLSADVAKDLELDLVYEAPDKYISNYSFAGGKLKQVDKLSEAGGVNAFVDDTKLVVKAKDAPLDGTMRILDVESGMVGIPEITEHGVKVSFLADTQTRVGGGLKLTSIMNPTLNGIYIIYKLGFEIASRDVPFYYHAECKRVQ